LQGQAQNYVWKKELYFCLESSYNFGENLQRLGNFFVYGKKTVVVFGCVAEQGYTMLYGKC